MLGIVTAATVEFFHFQDQEQEMCSFRSLVAAHGYQGKGKKTIETRGRHISGGLLFVCLEGDSFGSTTF
jgi:hypothetical protein